VRIAPVAACSRESAHLVFVSGAVGRLPKNSSIASICASNATIFRLPSDRRSTPALGRILHDVRVTVSDTPRQCDMKTSGGSEKWTESYGCALVPC
jgi:hypothetical protein